METTSPTTSCCWRRPTTFLTAGARRARLGGALVYGPADGDHVVVRGEGWSCARAARETVVSVMTRSSFPKRSAAQLTGQRRRTPSHRGRRAPVSLAPALRELA